MPNSPAATRYIKLRDSSETWKRMTPADGKSESTTPLREIDLLSSLSIAKPSASVGMAPNSTKNLLYAHAQFEHNLIDTDTLMPGLKKFAEREYWGHQDLILKLNMKTKYVRALQQKKVLEVRMNGKPMFQIFNTGLKFSHSHGRGDAILVLLKRAGRKFVWTVDRFFDGSNYAAWARSLCSSYSVDGEFPASIEKPTFPKIPKSLLQFKAGAELHIRRQHVRSRFFQRIKKGMKWNELNSSLRDSFAIWKRNTTAKVTDDWDTLFYQWYMDSKTGNGEIQGLLPVYFPGTNKRGPADAFATLRGPTKDKPFYEILTIVTRVIARTNCRIFDEKMALHDQLNKRSKRGSYERSYHKEHIPMRHSVEIASPKL